MAVEDEAINKPYRPIRTCLPSLEAARLRWAFSYVTQLLNEVVRNIAPEVDMRLDLDIWNAAFVMATVHVQEFHNVDGDRRTGRKTLPLLLATRGVIRLRQATAMALIAGSCMFPTWGWLNCGPGKSLNLHLFGVLQVIAGLGTAIRLVFAKIQNDV
ncbi:hypothetical protein GB937_005456 [Aspergillus fischeri]|nr:hypothetical protein GB937_005456 [Aspergillus fischeri]